ncbi:unnamed protein product [Arabidopsis thaliana]|uniref:Zinc finger GRF-type domain-containing protein n=1 Tax=Arabidopsis thaliana TaxID=3702 RepID=A0A654ETX2_ARATH|nr:unnamed protein product [Arabidopsis thaliana]
MSQNGITRRCFCGGLAIIQTSRTATNPGRIFYTCVMSGDGGNHIWKLCDEVMMEEIVQLGLEMQDLNNLIHCIPDSRTGHDLSKLSETIKIQKDKIAQTDEEIVRLKELIEKIDIGNAMELKNVVIGGLVVFAILVYLFK